MATEKKLNTRIILKHSDIDSWNSSALILKAGEVALVEIPASNNKPDGNKGKYDVPTYLMKVGDGKSKFSALKWVAATAADVYDWAKQETLPVKITGEGNAVTNVAWDASANTITVTKGSSFEAAGAAASALSSANAHSDENLKSAKEYADQAEADAVSTAAADATSKAGTAESNAKGHADGLNAKMDTRVKALEAAVGEGGSVDTQIDAKINLLDVKAVTAETGYIISSVGQENGKVVVDTKPLTADDIPSLTVAKISDYTTDVEKKIAAKGYATKSEAQSYADAKDSAIAAAKKAGTDAQGTADTAVANAATAQSKANTADEHAVDAQTRVGKIEADYLKKADKTELTNADAAQVKRIVALEGKIDGVTSAMHFKGVSTTDPAKGTVTIKGEVYQGESGDTVIYKTEDADTEFVYDGSAWIELGDTTQEAKAIKTLEGKMTAAEGKLSTIQGNDKTEGSINKALADAKSYADGKVSALAGGQVKTNTDAIATNTSAISTNTGNISKNTEAIEAINNSETGILTKAKAYADSLDTTMNGRVVSIENKVTGWDEAAGKANNAVQSVVEGNTNGTIKVDGTAVNVHGLGSAAYTASGAYATAAQGKKADTALQAADLTDLNEAKHTHSNKKELDKIASGDKAKWDAATTKANSALQEITTTEGQGLKVVNKNKIDIDESITFVLDCGDCARDV